MAKKAKNLNKNSQREFLLRQREMIDEQLAEPPELLKDDLLGYLEDYPKSLKENEFSKSTITVYLRGANLLVGDYSSNEEYLSKEDLIMLKQDLLDKYDKVQTINSYITAVNRFLFYCDAGEFKIMKVKGQGDNTLPYRIYEQEYKRMIRRAKADNLMELYFAMRLMAETGVRVVELKSFTGSSIQQTSVTVDNKGKVRRVPIPHSLGRDLRSYAKTMKLITDPIVRLEYKQLYDLLKDNAARCKINKKKIHPHAFRHYFGFNFVNKKGELKLAQLSDILGHSSVETTRVYTRGTLEDYLKSMEEIR